MNPCRRFAVALLITTLPTLTTPATQDPSVEGGSLPFRLPDLDGQIVSTEDLRGKILLVDLMGTWCPPCLTGIPTLVDLEERHGNDGLVIVSIAFEREKDPDRRRKVLQQFVEERGINYMMLDGGSIDDLPEALPTMRNMRGFPVEILIDREGRVVEARNGYGYTKRWASNLEKELVSLLHDAPE